MQRGLFEGGLYHAIAIAEHQAIKEAMQPCSERVSLLDVELSDRLASRALPGLLIPTTNCHGKDLKTSAARSISFSQIVRA